LTTLYSTLLYPALAFALHLLALSSLSVSMSQFQSTLKIVHIVNIEGYKLVLYYIFCDLRGHRFVNLNSSVAHETNYSELRVDLNPLCCSGTYTQVEKLKHSSVVTSGGEGGVRGCLCVVVLPLQLPCPTPRATSKWNN